jgi:5'-nucleotidase
MTITRPLILVSNDDGHASEGIRALARALSSVADVVIVAPETDRSATSHAQSLHHPLRLRAVEPGIFAIDGTPVDCVYVALMAEGRLLARRPDLVVSGINRGMNLAQDVFYSGTVAAAREGALRGVSAVAVGASPDADLAATGRLVTDLAACLIERPPSQVYLLNVNVPHEWTGAVRRTRLGARYYREAVEFRRDPFGREYLWIGGPHDRHDLTEGTDTAAAAAGVASITPLRLDLTGNVDDHLAACVHQFEARLVNVTQAAVSASSPSVAGGGRT